MPNYNPYASYDEPRIQDDYDFNYGGRLDLPATDIDYIPTPFVPSFSAKTSGPDWKKLALMAGGLFLLLKVV